MVTRLKSHLSRIMRCKAEFMPEHALALLQGRVDFILPRGHSCKEARSWGDVLYIRYGRPAGLTTPGS